MEYDHFWWLSELSDREANEIRLALDYVQNYNHGTPGHMDLLVIAKLANIVATMIEAYQTCLEADGLLMSKGMIHNIIDGMLIAPKPQP